MRSKKKKDVCTSEHSLCSRSSCDLQWEFLKHSFVWNKHNNKRLNQSGKTVSFSVTSWIYFWKACHKWLHSYCCFCVRVPWGHCPPIVTLLIQVLGLQRSNTTPSVTWFWVWHLSTCLKNVLWRYCWLTSVVWSYLSSPGCPSWVDLILCWVWEQLNYVKESMPIKPLCPV